MKTGQLYIVSAPSGAGKSSLLNALRSHLPQMVISVSHTTRAPRLGEENGVHYHFVSVESFREQITSHDFLEYAEVFGNYYGTSRKVVDELLVQGNDVILEIDWQGARQVRARAENVISIFIVPPSLSSLEERLRNRQQDNEDIIQRRMKAAQNEISHYPEYDYLIINDDFDSALQGLVSIFHSNHLRLPQQQQCHRALLSALLQTD